MLVVPGTLEAATLDTLQPPAVDWLMRVAPPSPAHPHIAARVRRASSLNGGRPRKGAILAAGKAIEIEAELVIDSAVRSIPPFAVHVS
jgi:hypothetical protein